MLISAACSQPKPISTAARSFGQDLTILAAVDDAAENLFWDLEDLAENMANPPHKLPNPAQLETAIAACRLYTLITGRPRFEVEALATLEHGQVERFLSLEVYKLITEARTTRQPIPVEALAQLYITPDDLLSMDLKLPSTFVAARVGAKWASANYASLTQKFEPDCVFLHQYHCTLCLSSPTACCGKISPSRCPRYVARKPGCLSRTRGI